MLDKELLIYPPRHLSPFNPGVPDRQLWAIGMIVVQWSMTEFIRDQHVHELIGGNASAKAEYDKLRNARQKNEFWKAQVETVMTEPERSQALALIGRVQNLNAQRDKIIHRAWGGGMQAGSWSAEDHETNDASPLLNRNEKKKTKSHDGRNVVRRQFTFDELRAVAVAMATLNRDLFMFAT
jgi:hypothetical protein